MKVIPATAESVSRVFLIQSALGCDFFERAITVVTHQEVLGDSLSVIVRTPAFAQYRALIEEVETEVDIEPTIAVVVGDCRAGECPLRRFGKLECVRYSPEAVISFVCKQDGTI